MRFDSGLRTKRPFAPETESRLACEDEKLAQAGCSSILRLCESLHICGGTGARQTVRTVSYGWLGRQPPKPDYFIVISSTSPVLSLRTMVTVCVQVITPSSATALAFDLDRPRMVSKSLS